MPWGDLHPVVRRRDRETQALVDDAMIDTPTWPSNPCCA